MEPDKYCYEHKHYYDPSEVCEKCAVELRSIYERAYFAALGGLAGIDGLADVETVYHAQQCALETVRQWPAMPPPPNWRTPMDMNEAKAMSRREEVEEELTAILRKTKRPQLAAAAIARTLADEVDAERVIVTKLLAMLEPGECKDWLGGYWLQKHTLYNRALEIAGRKE